MGLKFFHISSRPPDSIEAELNVFLARHRVVTVERRFVEDGADSFWAVWRRTGNGDRQLVAPYPKTRDLYMNHA
jgi:hypothetical protein